MKNRMTHSTRPALLVGAVALVAFVTIAGGVRPTDRQHLAAATRGDRAG